MTLGLKEWQEAENDLGRAYLRLRAMIGRAAFMTPHAPTHEQVWETTEKALAALLEERDEAQRKYHDLWCKLHNLTKDAS